MPNRKLQIFLSSTYEDLIDERLAAMEAILSAGHIPAAMEQFTPGDETAWEKICAWIGASDAFILILGGRYGSIEPNSGKSYVQLEYEYALQKKKPLFAMVISEDHHEERVKRFGLTVDERENQDKYKGFRSIVTTRLCAFWNDKKDIRATIFQKLPEWAQRQDLGGWVRANETATPQVMNELARLSHENSELRMATGKAEDFDGLTFDELVKVMEETQAAAEDLLTIERNFQLTIKSTLLDVFYFMFDPMPGTYHPRRRTRYPQDLLHAFVPLEGLGLIEKLGEETAVSITESGRRFRNLLLIKRRKAAQAPKRSKKK